MIKIVISKISQSVMERIRFTGYCVEHSTVSFDKGGSCIVHVHVHCSRNKVGSICGGNGIPYKMYYIPSTLVYETLIFAIYIQYRSIMRLLTTNFAAKMWHTVCFVSKFRLSDYYFLYKTLTIPQAQNTT
jgi:hypothetical protein